MEIINLDEYDVKNMT